jgi:exopolyphosphatase/guanosine-5'-triphosphate,3'-diphosphate pyrophosphatase
MEIKQIAAIDIGSNAIRLLINHIVFTDNQLPVAKKGSLVRVPIRIGADVFTKGRISVENTKRLELAMSAYRDLMEVNQVQHYLAFATSASRDAENGVEVYRQLLEKTGIQIEIIEGKREAGILYNMLTRLKISADENYLFVDVGGGSTQITLFEKGNIVISQSFNIGTLRLLHNFVKDETWEELKLFLKTNIVKNYGNLTVVGSGGNINKVFKLSKTDLNKPMNVKFLREELQYLQSMSYEDRIVKLDLNPDRADVIVPALEIYTRIMKWAECETIYVPKLGLVDGIADLALNQWLKKSASINLV